MGGWLDAGTADPPVILSGGSGGVSTDGRMESMKLLGVWGKMTGPG